MIKLFVTPQATNDLEGIFEYTTINWSFTQAQMYHDLLFESMNTILKSSNIGTIYIFKTGKYRKLKSSKHIIFYRIKDNKCIIIRVLHERMDMNMYLIF